MKQAIAIGMALELALVVMLGLVLALTLPSLALAQQGRGDSVWVNTRSGVYHCPGSPVFKTTRQGALMPESEARAKGHRPAGGVGCAPGGAAATTAQGEARASRDSSALPRRATTERVKPATTCQVTAITDGDGITCPPIGKIRLIGIDAPETDQEPFGAAATAALASFVAVGATVGVELDRDERDPFGRTLAYLWVGDVMVNWQMARMGWAVPVRYAPNLRYATELEAASAAASAERRGLWAIDGFACLPAARRRKEC